MHGLLTNRKISILCKALSTSDRFCKYLLGGLKFSKNKREKREGAFELGLGSLPGWFS